MLLLFDDEEFDNAEVLSEDGILKSIKPGTILVDHTTNSASRAV